MMHQYMFIVERLNLTCCGRRIELLMFTCTPSTLSRINQLINIDLRFPLSFKCKLFTTKTSFSSFVFPSCPSFLCFRFSLPLRTSLWFGPFSFSERRSRCRTQTFSAERGGVSVNRCHLMTPTCSSLLDLFSSFLHRPLSQFSLVISSRWSFSSFRASCSPLSHRWEFSSLFFWPLVVFLLCLPCRWFFFSVVVFPIFDGLFCDFFEIHWRSSSGHYVIIIR